MPWRPLALLALAAFWTVTLELLPAGMLPEMAADLQVRPSRVGLLVTVWALTIGLTSIPLARVLRRVSPSLVLGGALALVGLSTFAGAVTPGYGAVLGLRILAAVGHGLFWSVLLVYAASIAPQGRASRAVAVVNSGPLLASAVGLPVGTTLSAALGWRPVTAVVAVAMVLVGLVLAVRLPRVGGPQRGPRRGRRDPTAARVVAIAVLGALALVAHFLVFTFLATISTGLWAFPETSLGPLFLAFGAAGAVGLGLAGTVGDEWARLALVATVGGLAVVLSALAVPGVPTVLVYTLVALWGGLLGLLPPLLQLAVISAASAVFQPSAGAVLVTTFNLGIAAGAASGALMVDHLGLGWLLPSAVLVAVVSTVGLVVVGLGPGRR